MIKKILLPKNVFLFAYLCLLILLSAPATWALSAELPDLKRERSIRSNFGSPTAVALDAAENIYVSESRNDLLAIYDRNGTLKKRLAGLKKPTGVAVDKTGRIYVCNAGRQNVEVYDGNLRLLFELGKGPGEFRLPVAVALGTTGAVHVVDAKADAVKVYRSDGTFDFSFGGSGIGNGKFRFPTSIAVDEATGDLVVSDLQTTPTGIQGARIQVFGRNGAFKRAFGAYGRGEGLLVKPLGVAVDAGGRIYVSDAYQNIVHVFDGHGTYLKTLYDLRSPLRTPLGLAASRNSGKVYVASNNTSSVEVYGTEGGGDTGSLTMTASGGGGCSAVAGPAGTAAAAFGYLVPLLALLACLLSGRKGSAGRRAGGRVKRP